MPELLDHQKVGIPWLQDRERTCLFDEPGLGKSAQEILAATEPVLVIAPAMVLDSGTWDDEVAKWAPGIDLAQCSYHSLVEYIRTERGGNKPTKYPREEYRRRWGTVICDESHHMLGRGSKEAFWTTAIRRLETDRFSQATGTPLANWAYEAFNSLQFTYPEEARSGQRFGSYWRWVAEWFHVGPTLWQHRAVGEFKDEAHVRHCPDCEGSARTWEEFRTENWGDRMLLRTRDECLDLPPLTVQPWRVKMGKAQARAYRQIKKDFVTWLDTGLEVAAWNSAAQSVKLAKAATGLEILDRVAKGSAKLDALRSILEDRPRPTLVVAFFKETVAACARVAEEVGAEARVIDGDAGKKARREYTRAFQSGGLPVLCATIDTVREGMNLQTAADQVVRVEKSFLPSRNEQVLRRLHRLGQEHPVTCIDLLTADTLDERKEWLLEVKTDQQMKALGKADLVALA